MLPPAVSFHDRQKIKNDEGIDSEARVLYFTLAQIW